MDAVSIGRNILLAAACLASSACSTLSGYPTRPESAAVIAARQDEFFGPQAAENYNKLVDPTARMTERNRIVYGKVQVIGDSFLELERVLNGSGNAVSLGGDLTVLLLNGIAATTGSAATKSTLSVASAGIVGAQGAINKDLYYQRTLPALLAQMQANFEEQKAAIIAKLSRSDSEYPLKAAEVDLQRLEDAGSIPSAISQITEQAQSDKAAAEQKLNALRTLTAVNTPSATRLMAWATNADGSVNQTNYDLLQAWLNAQPEAYLHDYPPAALMAADTPGADLEPIRKRAVADPTLKIP